MAFHVIAGLIAYTSEEFAITDWIQMPLLLGQCGLLGWWMESTSGRRVWRLLASICLAVVVSVSLSHGYIWAQERQIPWTAFDWLGYFGGGAFGAMVALFAPWILACFLLLGLLHRRRIIWFSEMEMATRAAKDSRAEWRKQFTIADMLLATGGAAIVLGLISAVQPYGRWVFDFASYWYWFTRQLWHLIGPAVATAVLVTSLNAWVFVRKQVVLWRVFATIAAAVGCGFVGGLLAIAVEDAWSWNCVVVNVVQSLLLCAISALSFIAVRASRLPPAVVGKEKQGRGEGVPSF